MEVRKMSPKTIGVTAAILLLVATGAFIAVVGVVDAWLIDTWGIDASISRGMERMGYFWPAIPFMIGMLAGLLLGFLGGHFWAPQPPIRKPDKQQSKLREGEDPW